MMRFSVAALTTPASAVAPATLADSLGCDASDPLLPALCFAATEAVGAYIRRPVTVRQLRATIYEWPTTGARGSFVSGSMRHALDHIELPQSDNTTTVQSVTDGKGAPLDYELRSTTPAEIYLTPTEPVIVTYTSGFDAVPYLIQQAVLLTASYLFEHRGQCDVGDAVALSGAAALVAPFRVEI